MELTRSFVIDIKVLMWLRPTLCDNVGEEIIRRMFPHD